MYDVALHLYTVYAFILPWENDVAPYSVQCILEKKVNIEGIIDSDVNKGRYLTTTDVSLIIYLARFYCIYLINCFWAQTSISLLNISLYNYLWNMKYIRCIYSIMMINKRVDCRIIYIFWIHDYNYNFLFEDFAFIFLCWNYCILSE